MRIPTYLSVVLLSTACYIAWQDRQRLVAAREDLAKLVDEADREGISAAFGQHANRGRNSGRQRLDSRQAAISLADDWMLYQRELELLDQPGEQPDEAMLERENLLWERARPLDTAGWESFLARALEALEVSEAVRRNLVYMAISSIARRNPQAALDRLHRASSLFKDDHRGNELAGLAIRELAKINPVAAATWIRENGNHPSGFVTDQTRISLINGTASTHPELAFQLIGELGIKDTNNAFSSLAINARTFEQKSAILAALRGHLATSLDASDHGQIELTVLRGLASTFAYGNFGEARRWFESTDLSARELAYCADALQSSVLRNETGQWIEWFAGKLTPDASKGVTKSMIDSWARDDHEAAGKWISEAPDIPIRDAAIWAFAVSVSKHESATAVEWALTLPPGEDRYSALANIHRNWPEDDPAAKAAFAEEHGIR